VRERNGVKKKKGRDQSDGLKKEKKNDARREEHYTALHRRGGVDRPISREENQFQEKFYRGPMSFGKGEGQREGRTGSLGTVRASSDGNAKGGGELKKRGKKKKPNAGKTGRYEKLQGGLEREG